MRAIGDRLGLAEFPQIGLGAERPHTQVGDVAHPVGRHARPAEADRDIGLASRQVAHLVRGVDVDLEARVAALDIRAATSASNPKDVFPMDRSMAAFRFLRPYLR